jgi:acyl-CoA dehydrogenase
MGMITGAFVMGIADGPTEVHKVTVAKQVLRDYPADNALFPAYHLPRLREAAADKYAAELDALKRHYAAKKAEPARA